MIHHAGLGAPSPLAGVRDREGEKKKHFFNDVLERERGGVGFFGQTADTHLMTFSTLVSFGGIVTVDTDTQP